MQSDLPNNIQESKSRLPVFSIRTLLWVTLLVSWIFGANNWLGAPFGLITAIPLIICMPILVLRPWSLLGGVIGFVTFALIGEFAIIGWQKSDPEYLRSLFSIGSFGIAVGAAIYSFIVGLRALGAITLILTLIAFAGVIFLPF